MTFTSGQLVICTDANGLSGVLRGRVYRITRTWKIAGVPAVALDEHLGHFFASRFRPISEGQIAIVESIMGTARIAAKLQQMRGRDAA